MADKQQIVMALKQNEMVTYDKGKFNVIKYDESNDTFSLLHRDHLDDLDMACYMTSTQINYAKIKMTDKKTNGEKSNMKNITYKVSGNKLLIEINLDEKQGKSKSGKNLIVATTGGNAKIEGTDMVLGLNLYTKDAQ